MRTYEVHYFHMDEGELLFRTIAESADAAVARFLHTHDADEIEDGVVVVIDVNLATF